MSVRARTSSHTCPVRRTLSVPVFWKGGTRKEFSKVVHFIWFLVFCLVFFGVFLFLLVCFFVHPLFHLLSLSFSLSEGSYYPFQFGSTSRYVVQVSCRSQSDLALLPVETLIVMVLFVPIDPSSFLGPATFSI